VEVGTDDQELPELPATLSASGGEASAGRKAISELLGDRYEILSKLGSGAFGEVYAATDTTLHRKVAIKRIRLDAFAEGPQLEEVKRRFVREAQVAAQLRHPSLVTIHDIAAKGSSSFMVMELVEGRTLQAHLRERGRLDLEETVHIVSQAAAALDYAHGRGVVHRDIKPANLMIEPSGHVKVMDFGIAKAEASGNITRTGAILGTPNYMSPEQARGDAVDGRADLFSLGCILYECLSGQRPFVGDSVTAILLKILNEAPPPIDFRKLKLPAPLGEVLGRALAKDPKERYPTGQRLTEALREAAALTAARTVPLPAEVATIRSETSTLASAPQPAPAPAPPWRRIALVGAAAAVVIGLLWTASASRRIANGPATTGGDASGSQRLSPRVTKEAPGLVSRLLGGQPKLHIAVPAGSAVRVRLETPLSSETAQAGHEFTASTRAAFVVDGFAAIPEGSRVRGHVAQAAASGKVSGRAELTLEFDRIITPGGKQIAIEAEPVRRRARSGAKNDAARVAGGAGVGAVVGGLLGGKEGAAIGAAVGGSAGAGAVLATKGEEVILPEGAALELRLRQPLKVTVEAPSPDS
jgi:serine/threonine-protein kinase